MYIILKVIYCDQDQHFDNLEMNFFFKFYEISIDFNFSKVSQSTEMIELKNKLLQKIFRKSYIN